MTSDFQRADRAASAAHDFIHGRNGVTKAQADEAIWEIHDVLRPLIPLSEHPEYEAVIASVKGRCTSCGAALGSTKMVGERCIHCA